jgi:hypothetical protein
MTRNRAGGAPHTSVGESSQNIVLPYQFFIDVPVKKRPAAVLPSFC